MGNNGNVVEVIPQSGEYIQKVEYRGGDIFDVLGLYTQTGTDFCRVVFNFISINAQRRVLSIV